MFAKDIQQMLIKILAGWKFGILADKMFTSKRALYYFTAKNLALDLSQKDL